MEYYTEEDARFDAEARGDCGVCGRTPSKCGHCKECGKRNKHAKWCYYNEKEDVCDNED